MHQGYDNRMEKQTKIVLQFLLNITLFATIKKLLHNYISDSFYNIKTFTNYTYKYYFNINVSNNYNK